MRKRLGRLKVEMEAISKEQQSIKDEQSQVRTKFNAVEEEYEQLRSETNRIIQQTANTQIQLGLMFGILRAREEGDLGKAAQLTGLLRDAKVEHHCGRTSNSIDLKRQTCQCLLLFSANKLMDNSRAAFGPFNGTTPATVTVIIYPDDNGGSASNSKYIFGGGFGVSILWVATIIFMILKIKRWGSG
ncbi:uncharacterized protein LOC120120188 [Hibiscus syriacus]|uniref:uncharacterized protein LOC120120188 n=1 Tax=Hibiscus syriacus TaxID=106335 RepID=UPI0019228B16|nr:uncharacterized protein LOC120120188 [Hibiscus syriacus]